MSKIRNRTFNNRMEKLDPLFALISTGEPTERTICFIKCTNFLVTPSCEREGNNVGRCRGETVYANSTPCIKERK